MEEDGSWSSDNKERIHKISTVQSAKTLYSASVEDLAIVHCFPNFHEIGVEPRYIQKIAVCQFAIINTVIPISDSDTMKRQEGILSNE
jgi:hypothetical protein